MIGIERIASYLPIGILDNTKRFNHDGQRASLNASGFKQLRRASEDETQVEMCFRAFCNLPPNVKASIEPGIIIVNTSFSKKNLPSLSYQLHNRLNMSSDVFCLDIILGCTGFVQSCLVLKSLMKEMKVTQALLFNVEKYSDILDPKNFSTELLFSDAATVCLISTQGEWKISNTKTFNFSEYNDYISINQTKLSMNASDLYKKLSCIFPNSLLEFLYANKITIESIDKFLFHQASLKVIAKFRIELELDSSRVPFDAETTGNTGSCSLPLLLEKHINKEYKKFILSGFGSGLAISHLLLEHNPDL